MTWNLLLEILARDRFECVKYFLFHRILSHLLYILNSNVTFIVIAFENV